MVLTSVPRRLVTAAKMMLAIRSYRRSLVRGAPTGSVAHHVIDWAQPEPPLVERRLWADGRAAVELDEPER
jgi:hypothetical protein